MFVGRKNELKLIEDAYRTGKDELVVLYGRRRIGKILYLCAKRYRREPRRITASSAHIS